MTKAGFVALIGIPNAGKSTLLNALVGQKVSIVSHKVQTTRSCIRGVVVVEDTQIVFVDTPGIFQPKRRLDRAMVSAAWEGAGDVDATVLLIDARKGICDQTESIIQQLQKNNRQVYVALNKIDTVARPKLLKLAQKVYDTGIAKHIFMISALKNDGVGDLKKILMKEMPEAPWFYPEDEVTDLPTKLLAAEITREKIYNLLHDELPYNSTVETEALEIFKNGAVRLEQVIYVMREGQRKIFLGKNGQTIKEIGQLAREDLQKILERPVHLFLFVKVREEWQNDPARYETWGLKFNAA